MNEETSASKDKVMVAIRSCLKEERISCTAVFAIAQEQGWTPEAVVAAAESAGIRIGWCQLGLFGGKEKIKPTPWPVEEIPPELRAALQSAAKEGRLPCARAWAIAQHLGRERREIGRAAHAMGIRIGKCQLNCF